MTSIDRNALIKREVERLIIERRRGIAGIKQFSAKEVNRRSAAPIK
jgi:hypothetical protein